MKYENGDVTFKCGEKSIVVSIDDCPELKDVKNLHTFLELDLETKKGVINDNDRTPVKVKHAIDIDALRKRLCKQVEVSYGVRTSHHYGVMMHQPDGDDVVIGITQAIMPNAIPIPPDQLEEVRQGWLYDDDTERFKPKPLNKQERLLKGFSWFRGNGGGRFELSVTQQDTVSILECKMQFELDIAKGEAPSVEILTFANGTKLRAVTPDDVQSILLTGSVARAEIEKEFSH